VDVGQKHESNLAVTGLMLGAPVATTGTITPITATIHNYGTEPKDQVRRAAAGSGAPPPASPF
jgi:hypothetical protein